jgi:cardiolipin synthase A/B
VPRLQFWRRPATLPPIPDLQQREQDLKYALHPRSFLPGNRVEVLRDGGRTYPAMLAAIEGARDYVHLETYILVADRTGRRFGEALIGRARAGVQVRLLYDALGSIGLSADFLAELRHAGVRVAEYNPVAPWRARFGLNQRDHRKILVVDGRCGFTGGLNISDDYAAVEDGGAGWHDMHCRIEGPAVAELERLFRRTWIKAGGDVFPPVEPLAAESVVGADTALARIFGNEGLRKRTPIRRVYLHAIRRAQQTIAITNAYFIPDRGIRRALVNAVKRGVQVRVVVPSRSDVPAVQWATRHLYTRLLKAGVHVYEWAGRMVHAKTAVIDEIWSTVGSSNLDYRSLKVNLEVVAIVIDRNFGRRMAEQFVLDVAESDEVRLDVWRRRPWWHRPLEWLFFQLRSLL